MISKPGTDPTYCILGFSPLVYVELPNGRAPTLYTTHQSAYCLEDPSQFICRLVPALIELHDAVIVNDLRVVAALENQFIHRVTAGSILFAIEL